MVDVDGVRKQILLAAQTAHLGAGSWLHERRHMFGLTDVDVPATATRDTVLIQAALTYLAANGLVTFADAGQFGVWLTTGFDEPWATIMSENLVAAVAAAAPVHADAVRPWPPRIVLDPRLVADREPDETHPGLVQDVWGPPGEPVDPLLGGGDRGDPQPGV
jgi:hypothetical protein